MKKIITFLLVTILLFGTLTAVQAEEISLPDLISNHMLMQQAKPIKLWGTGPAGETLIVTLGSASKTISAGTTTIESDGSFRIELPPAMAGGPYKLSFSTPSGTKTVSDVLVGELWVQCGQSLMATTVNSTGNHKEEILPKETRENIRLFINTATPTEEERKTTGTTRQTDLKGKWTVATREAAGTYSAMGYSALSKLYDELNLPVGGICSAVGGTAMSYYQVPPQPYEDKNFQYGTYFNIKVAPLTQLNIRGIMWNQGSADRWNQNFVSDFKKLIQGWRTEWQDEDMPFIFATSFPSPMKYYASWNGSYIMEDFSIPRLAQTQVYNEVENTGIAVSIDCAPVVGVDRDPLHPNIRKPAGERLALSALGLVYGKTDRWSSPMYHSASVSGNTATITFSHAYDGLKTKDNQPPRCFMVAGADGVFHHATARIEGNNKIVLTSNKVSEIKQISYAVEKYLFPYESNTKDNGDWVQDTYPDVNLVNSENLPALSFAYDVTTVIEEKKYAHSVTEPTNIIVPLNDSYLFPDTFSIDGEQKRVFWSKSSINTKKEGTLAIYGFAEDCDMMISLLVTVKDVKDNPVGNVTVTKDGNDAIIRIQPDSIQANRNCYLITCFYDSSNQFLSSRTIPQGFKAGQTETIEKRVAIPETATMVKCMIVNHQLSPYYNVTKLNLQ